LAENERQVEMAARHWEERRRFDCIALSVGGGAAYRELAQPKATSGSSYSNQQMLAAALGMPMNNLGMHMISQSESSTNHPDWS
jgi:hypothetical protein